MTYNIFTFLFHPQRKTLFSSFPKSWKTLTVCPNTDNIMVDKELIYSEDTGHLTSVINATIKKLLAFIKGFLLAGATLRVSIFTAII